MSNNTPMWFNFTSAGVAGSFAWFVVHPFNTASVRMNLASASGAPSVSFLRFISNMAQNQGILSLYDGLTAGVLRQTVYATARVGLFEVFRDELGKHRPVDFVTRFVAGVSSGACAALISCPSEVTLVRLSNDSTLPESKRRNYSGVVNAFTRILNEEGVRAFFRGCAPFINRAILVGAVQVGTYDQFRESFKKWGVTSLYANVMCSSMCAGLLYSLVTNPFETAKNRMAFQMPDKNGQLMYNSTVQTLKFIAKNEGPIMLWAGFIPYFLRCGGHTIVMFISMEWARKLYAKQFSK